MKTSRRSFIRTSALVSAGALVPRNWWMARLRAAQSPQTPLAAGAVPQFIDPLPSLDAIVAGTGQIELQMTEFQAQVLPTGMAKS